jgi:1-acyl-sn-glycerol-3-phosphate acyltransferase
MLKLLRQLWLPVAYYLSWIWFGLGGLLLNLAFGPLLLLPNRERHGPRVRRITRWMFSFWLRWMHASGVVRVTWNGFDRPLPTGVVYVANHPCLVDAPFLFARLPDTVCIFKPALLRNPFIAPTALLCGYVSAGENGVDLIRNSVERLQAGQSLLIFPEGTRTASGTALNPLKPGFALIARLADRPVQLIRVRSSPLLARKSCPWWRVPPLPGWVEFTLDELIPAEEIDSPATFSERIATHFKERLPLVTDCA